MHFFWIFKKSLKGVLAKYLIWTGPRLCPKISHYPEIDRYYKKQTKSPNLKIHSKRNVSLFPSFQGSITVETAFALPLFLIFCIQLISLISLIQLHSAMEMGLHQEVSQLSLKAYAYEKVGVDTEEVLVDLLGDLYLKEQVIRRVGKEYLDHSMIEGGSEGIHISYGGNGNLLGTGNGNGGQDEIEVTLTYQVKPVVDILGFSGFSMANRCCMKAWTGYRQPAAETESTAASEEFVYITENGTVYHKSRGCSHLTLSIREVEKDRLGSLRNEDGGKYYACEYCGGEEEAAVFITDQGNRYHTSLTCGGLKRTIYVVRLSETRGRGPCSRCAGTG